MRFLQSAFITNLLFQMLPEEKRNIKKNICAAKFLKKQSTFSHTCQLLQFYYCVKFMASFIWNNSVLVLHMENRLIYVLRVRPHVPALIHQPSTSTCSRSLSFTAYGWKSDVSECLSMNQWQNETDYAATWYNSTFKWTFDWKYGENWQNNKLTQEKNNHCDWLNAVSTQVFFLLRCSRVRRL